MVAPTFGGNAVSLAYAGGDKTFALISQPGYTGEYRLGGNGIEHFFSLKHLEEKGSTNGFAMDRHYVGLRHHFDETNAREDLHGKFAEAYIICRMPQVFSVADMQGLLDPLFGWAGDAAIQAKYLAWQSV